MAENLNQKTPEFKYSKSFADIKPESKVELPPKPHMSDQGYITTSNIEPPVKKSKRGVIFLTVFTLFVVAFFTMTTPALKGLSSCIENYSADMKLIGEKRVSENWTKSQFCTNDKTIAEKYINCSLDVNKKSLIPLQVITFLGGLIDSSVKNTTPVKVKDLHNSFCADIKQSLIN